MKETVHIIGAGFSGMTLAYRLSQKGIPVIVYDKGQEIGGMISTHSMGPTFAETAAPSISRTQRVEDFCKELGVDFITPSEKSKNRFIFRGEIKKWPLGVFETLGLISRAVIAKLTGKLAPRPLETLEQWGVRNLGARASHFTIETAMQGVYAGDARELSASLLLGPLFKKNRERFKGALGFKSGMTEFFAALKTKIEAQGAIVLLKSNVDLDLLKGPVVIATSADKACDLLKSRSQNLSSLLEKIQMIPLITATVVFEKVENLPEGFGCLIPRSQNLKTLGVLINSSIFDRGWNSRSETWIIGGATEPDLVASSESEIKEMILTERKQIFNTEAPIRDARIFRWNKALPHYTVELEKILLDLEIPRQQLETEQRIFLHGNYLGGVGLSKILEQTDTLAERIQKCLV